MDLWIVLRRKQIDPSNAFAMVKVLSSGNVLSSVKQ